MINDHYTLIATGILGLFFIISGFSGIIDNMLVRILLIAGFVAIIVNIIIIKSKDNDEKNLPE